MPDFYQSVFELLPGFLKRRINPLEFAIEAFVRSAWAPGKQIVLDAGAGQSRFGSCFVGQFYIALDSRVGDRTWDYSKIDLCADLDAIPLAPGRVDTVIHTQVLEHVENPAAVLAEIFRVLKPGGKLYMTAPQGWHEHQQPHDFFRFTRYSLCRLLESAGFQRMRIEPMGGYFHYLGQRLTYVPKVLFRDRRGGVRVLLFPFELISLGLFCFFLPLLCYYLDPLDAKQEFTLGYRCLAVKGDERVGSRE